MNLKYDFDIEIATGHTRTAKRWKNERIKWSSLIDRCAETVRTKETAKEYAKMSKEEQSSIKDVGGFVGGYLQGGTRKAANVVYRTCATLDIDYGTANVWDDFTMSFSFAAMLYSTHKHSKENPRFRLVFPFNRSVNAYEYEALCRRIAAEIGIDLFDDTTYELPRLFYWPSTSKDAEYVFEFQDGPACDVDQILGGYRDYKDVSEWPLSSRESDVIVRSMKKAGKPEEKPGLIGAFCRAYSIEDAIETFLPDVYERTATDGRYTYKAGSVAAGLVCYEHSFAYSHHETDPASRELCNAFDLVRIHKFGVRDENSKAKDVTKLPSYGLMQEFAANDAKVRILLSKEKQASASSDFADLEENDNKPVDDSWMARITRQKNGNPEQTSKNILTILENDPNLAGHLWHDEFSGFDLVKGGLPWDKKATQWTDRDDANLRIYFEEKYDIVAKDKIKDAKEAILTKNRIHPIREYLNGLKWDGVPRLDRLIIDYLGAADTPLNRAMTRKHFTAAVARVMQPGCKYDYCLIIAGPEGYKKSTLFNVMAGDWFNDSLTTMEGKEGMEQLRCAWIIELAELVSVKRSEVESVKNYISRREDIYRAAYSRTVIKHPRQCVFCGTTNERYFLKGDTGNRRFWVIPLEPELHREDDFIAELQANRDQLWAEAVRRYKDGEKLYLDTELEAEAKQRQEAYNDDADDPLISIVTTFLNRKLPVTWDAWDTKRRREHLYNPDTNEEIGSVERTRVSIPEIVCEGLKKDMSSKDYKYIARRVAKIMRDMPDWEPMATSRHVEKLYGVQRAYRKITKWDEDVNGDI